LNPDLLKIRNSRLFKQLPERAFKKAQKYIKIRSHLKAEDVLTLDPRNTWRNYFGYVVEGKVLFLTTEDKPVGLAVKDEFYLGRPFKLGDHSVHKLVAATDHCLVVYIPKEIVEILSSASSSYAEMIEEIYDSIFERSELMAGDVQGAKHYKEWLESTDQQKTLASWLGQLEKKRQSVLSKLKKEKRARIQTRALWLLALGVTGTLALEAFLRMGIFSWAPSLFFMTEVGEFEPGSEFNINIGIVGVCLLVGSNVHSLSKLAIRRFKWKINYQSSVRIHIFMGIVGTIFILFHTAGYMKGLNVAHLAVYFMLATILSGLIGQLISSQIPRSIQGEKVKLSVLKKDMGKLREKTKLLMEEDIYKTSTHIIVPHVPRSFWKRILFSPSLWWRQRRLRSELARLGLTKATAELGSQLLIDQFKLEQKVKNLEVANVFFRRWMWIHQPFAYILYIFAALHIVIVTWLA